jgi:hypothetical protein
MHADAVTRGGPGYYQLADIFADVLRRRGLDRVFPDSQTFRQVVNSGLEGAYLITAHPTCTLVAWSLLRQVTSRLHNVRIAERLNAKRMWKGA